MKLYQDAVWTGNRQYRQTSLGNNIVTMEDVTDYEQEGTTYSARDVNNLYFGETFDGLGYGSKTTTFNPDGSILDTYTDGTTAKTVFNEDGSISVELSVDGELVATKTTTFNSDGSITDTVEEE